MEPTEPRLSSNFQGITALAAHCCKAAVCAGTVWADPTTYLPVLWFSRHSVQYKFLNISCSESFFTMQNHRMVQCLIPSPPLALYSCQFLCSMSKQLWFKGRYSTCILLHLPKPPNTHTLPSAKISWDSYTSQENHLSVVKSAIQCKKPSPCKSPNNFHGAISEFQPYPNIMSHWISPVSNDQVIGSSPWAPAGKLPLQPTQLLALSY